MPSVHLELSGRVQGVGFRWYAVEAARRADLAGWVRNRADGSVEILAAADDAAAIERFVEAMRRGPPGARIEDVRFLSPDRAVPEARRPFAVLR